MREGATSEVPSDLLAIALLQKLYDNIIVQSMWTDVIQGHVTNQEQ